MKARHMMLSARVKDYLEYRRSLGFKLEMGELVLGDFAKYVRRIRHRGPLTSSLMLRWATVRPEHSTRYQAERLSLVRGFARYLAARDGESEVPEQRLLGPRFRRGQPHIYSDEELVQLATGARFPRMGALRSATYSTVFGLLSSTGMRVSEAIGLRVADVDLRRGLLHIRQTKFRKERLLPLHTTAVEALRRYARARGSVPTACSSQWFFVGRGGAQLPYSSLRHAFRRLCSRLRWKGNGDLPRPRIHDLRHTFAVRRLLCWYRDGVDVEQAIMSLSTYLGHGKVSDTYWYLTGTRELLALGGDRFERFARSAGRLP